MLASKIPAFACSSWTAAICFGWCENVLGAVLESLSAQNEVQLLASHALHAVMNTSSHIAYVLPRRLLHWDKMPFTHSISILKPQLIQKQAMNEQYIWLALKMSEAWWPVSNPIELAWWRCSGTATGTPLLQAGSLRQLVAAQSISAAQCWADSKCRRASTCCRLAKTSLSQWHAPLDISDTDSGCNEPMSVLLTSVGAVLLGSAWYGRSAA